jgi:O-antigen/teichoic acid export membrane protein
MNRAAMEHSVSVLDADASARIDAAPVKLALLAKNSIANLMRSGANWVIVLVVPPLLVRLLDHAGYATWMLVLQIGAYATLFDGGLQLAIGRFVARAGPAEDANYLGKVLSSATALLTVTAAVVFAAAACVALNLGSLFQSIPREIVPQAQTALLLAAGSLALAMPTSAFAGLCLGLEKNEINAAAVSASRIVGAAGTLWAAFHHQGLVVMALWTAGGTLMQPILYLLATRVLGAGAHFRIRLVSLGMVKQFGRFCAATFASQFGMLLISGLDLPIVAAFDFRNAGYYALAVTASNLLAVPQTAILTTLVPMMSSMSAGEPAPRMGNVLLRTARLANALLMLGAVPLMLGMPVLLRLWVGEDYSRHTLAFAETLMGAQLVRMTLLPYSLIGFSAGEQGKMLASPLIESVVNLILSLILVRGMGAEGVAIGTLIGAFAGIALHFAVSMRRTRSMEFSRRKLFWQAIVQPVVWAMAPALVLQVCLMRIAAPGAQIMLLCAVTAGLGAIYWRRHLDAGERAVMLEAGARLLPARLRAAVIGARG